MVESGDHPPAVLDYCIQHLGAMQDDIMDESRRLRVRALLMTAAERANQPYAGTALYALAENGSATPAQEAELRILTLALCTHGANPVARIAAIQLAGQRGYAEVSPLAAPRLAVPPEGVAFGEIAAGEGAAKSIEIRNVSAFPVLALIVRELGAWRSFALLALYNRAFIAPLVAVFMLAAKGADAAQMSRWSKRNVFPSKLALHAQQSGFCDPRKRGPCGAVAFVFFRVGPKARFVSRRRARSEGSPGMADGRRRALALGEVRRPSRAMRLGRAPGTGFS